MKVIHIESGLGNQMLGYMEYLAIKEANPTETCYIETILSEVPECGTVTSQWNGYELNKIFGIEEPNIKDLFNDEEWSRVVDRVRESEFWLHDWDYANAIVSALNAEKPELNLEYDDPWKSYKDVAKTRKGKIRKNLSWIKKTALWYHFSRFKDMLNEEALVKKEKEWMDKLFYKDSRNLYCGFTLRFRYRNGALERMENQYRKCFVFPELDDKNQIAANEIKACEAVAVHARRGDMLSYNGKYYKYGYFVRAIRFIKHNVTNPVFYIFCDAGSTEWCKENLAILGLDKKTDIIRFVDWNKGLDSYKDMQLMAMCKHNVVTNSSFGLWGAWLNPNKDKITCSPEIMMNTTNHF